MLISECYVQAEHCFSFTNWWLNWTLKLDSETILASVCESSAR